MSEPIPYILELTIPFCPPRLDNLFRQHFQKRNKEIKKYHAMIYYAVLGKKPITPLKRCSITIVRHCSRLLDWDNVVSSMKPFIDGLVHAGVLKDDTYAITGPWSVSQIFRSKKEGDPFTYIKIEGIQEAKQGPIKKSSKILLLEKKREGT